MDKAIRKLIFVGLIGGGLFGASLVAPSEIRFAPILLLYFAGIYYGKIVFGGYHTHLKMPGSEKSALCGEHTDKTEVTENLEDVDCEICLKNEIERLNDIMETAGIV